MQVRKLVIFYTRMLSYFVGAQLQSNEIESVFSQI